MLWSVAWKESTWNPAVCPSLRKFANTLLREQEICAFAQKIDSAPMSRSTRMAPVGYLRTLAKVWGLVIGCT
jgi:hypothetical protein